MKPRVNLSATPMAREMNRATQALMGYPVRPDFNFSNRPVRTRAGWCGRGPVSDDRTRSRWPIGAHATGLGRREAAAKRESVRPARLGRPGRTSPPEAEAKHLGRLGTCFSRAAYRRAAGVAGPHPGAAAGPSRQAPEITRAPIEAGARLGVTRLELPGQSCLHRHAVGGVPRPESCSGFDPARRGRRSGVRCRASPRQQQAEQPVLRQPVAARRAPGRRCTRSITAV